jgi:hypothetical protein
MFVSRRSALLLLLFALAGVLVVLLTQTGSGPDEEVVVLHPGGRVADPDGSGEPAVELIVPPAVSYAPSAVGSTTVLWPLRIELDLLQADYLPTEPGVSAVGTGATATLVGRITGVDDRGARAEIRFTAGANAGRTLRTDATGRFGATDLYPGISVAEIRGAGLLGSRREVRLRQRRQTQLNIGFGRPGTISGRVQNSTGEGIEGAQVFVDGTRVVTGVDGGFFLVSVAAGRVLVEVEAPGYTATKEVVGITGGKILTEKQATFTLKESASLVIAVPNNVGGPGPVQVVILPQLTQKRSSVGDVARNAGFPWHRINPIEVWPGRPVTVEGLPDKVVDLHAFRQGASAPQKVVSLRGGETQTVEIVLKPAPKITGRITREGAPVAGATVRLEAPNRVRATLAYFRKQSFFLESAVIPDLPVAVQEVETDERGRYVLTAWSSMMKVRYLEAIGPRGGWAGQLVHEGEEVIDLALKEVELATAALELDFPDRWQGLPLEILVDGAPFDPLVLPAGEQQSITDLRAGRWRLTVTWHGDPVHREEELEIDAHTARTIVLPLGAIDGQDEEQWRRAGRVHPGE